MSLAFSQAHCSQRASGSRCRRPHLPVRHPTGLQRSPGLHRGDQQVARSFLGVGAPEALLVGVVALVVFGPKGLADAAKSGASALKQFQPTLRELSQVSNELKTNITNEMGLDELQRDIRDLQQTTRSTFSTSATPAPAPSQPAASSSDEAREKGAASSNGASAAAGGAAASKAVAPGMDNEERRALREISEGLAGMDERQASAAAASAPGGAAAAVAEDPDIERKRRESAALAWGGNVPQELSASDSGALAGGAAAKGGEKKRLEDMTMAELEAELAKRKALVDRIKASEA